MSYFKTILQKYTNCNSERDRYTDLWEKIAKYVSVRYRDSIYTRNDTKNQQLDKFVEDSTAALAVQQASDYSTGIIRGNSDDMIEIVPSRYVNEISEFNEVADYFRWATGQVLYHVNHPRSNFTGSLAKSLYGDWSFGSSGLGAFKNKSFINGIDDNCITFRSYNVDSISFAEGASGLIEFVFAEYQWTVSRIVREFCFSTGSLDDLKLSQLPKSIQDAYKAHDLNKTFMIICGICPRDEYNPILKGKKGTRYRAVWWEKESANPFSEEDFKDMPINVCRMIQVPNEQYGRSPLTIMLSAIRMLNFIMGETIEALEKMIDPNLWTFQGAINGDDVIDTSAGEMLFLDPEYAQYGSPLNPTYQVQDITGVIQFLIPELRNQITTAGKVDVLLDFNTDASMTATETIQRSNIRSKSLAGIMTQIKNEKMYPTMLRAVNICWDCGELGINPLLDPEKAERMAEFNSDMIIPSPVLEVIKNGKPWFDIKFNNEMEDIVRSREVEKSMQQMNGLMTGAQVNPALIETEDIYDWYLNFRKALGVQGELKLSSKQFYAKMEDMKQAQSNIANSEQNELDSKTAKNTTEALNNVAREDTKSSNR